MSKKIQKILENNGFNVNVIDGGYEVSQYTDAGEDWCMTFTNLEDIVDYAENFDPEENFTMWIKAKQNGVRGVPSVPELWKDQLWKQELLNKVVNEIDLRSKK